MHMSFKLWSPYLFFSLVAHALNQISGTIARSEGMKAFYTLAFMFRSLIQWSSFFCVVWGKVQLHLFVSSCPGTVWTDLFPLRFLGHPCWKSVGVHVWVYFWALSSNPLICVSVLSQYYTVLINFVLGLKSGSMSPPTLFFFFEIILALQAPLLFHVNLKISFFISAKKAPGIVIGSAVTFSLGCCCHLHDIQSSNPGNTGSFHLFKCLISEALSYSFWLCTSCTSSVINLFPSIVFFLMVSGTELFSWLHFWIVHCECLEVALIFVCWFCVLPLCWTY